jgi:hypothetical protein
LGGYIAVHSEVGRGSEFTLFIPNNPPRHLREDIADGNEAQMYSMSV